MTIEYLEWHYDKYLTLCDLYAKIERGYDTRKSPSFNRFPGSSGRKSNYDPVTRALHRLEKLRADYDRLFAEIEAEDRIIAAWAGQIEDRKVNDAISWHFIFGKSWPECTNILGCYPFSPKTLFYRYMKEHPEMLGEDPREQDPEI